MKYLITYDNKPPRNYTALYTLLNSWSAARVAESVWLAELKGPASAVRDLVRAKLDPSDRVVVIELKTGSDWATCHALPAGNDWLKRNL
ncbi:hypothetical protein DXH95_03235 [Sphingorhabdus pulchriflava]|uniref:CRISPR-associated protein Cas2 n=1 Tax=Sphingorhabdus pulchriflava TaxID=2292257 RepID=A0A371BFT9_9SPHN|nr:hypothetical protein [Sphingorhabdus pulchriflava]RDV06454.1 hypothetical protein DXH95_03235 [Sphingorhabdus pulchriflava]